MAEAAEESSKENYCNGWPPGGRKFSEADREFPAAREATEKENTAAAGSGRAGWREISEKYRESPLNIRNIGLSVWKDACFCSPPARHGRVYFQKENSRSGGAGWRK